MKLCLLILVSLSFLAAAKKNNVFMVSSVSSESDDQSSLISVRYKKGVPSNEIKIEEHGTFIQVKVPNTVVSEPGTFYDGNSPYFRKVAAFQIDESTVGFRLFVTQETKSLISSLSTEYLSDRLLIHLDHKTVKPVLIDDSPPVEEVIARTTVRNNIKDPAEEMKATTVVPEQASTAKMSDELKEKLGYITIVIAIFMAIVIASIMVRKLTSRIREPAAAEKSPVMKTLASQKLAPKQTLTLVEVGGQQVLLGVSPDGISFLTSIDDTPKVTAPPQMMSSHAPQQVSATPNPLLQSPKGPTMNQSAGRANQMLESLTKKTMEPKANYQRKSTSPSLDKIMAEKDYEGVKTNFSSQTKASPNESKSIEDVTNLIRSKLKNLPSV